MISLVLPRAKVVQRAGVLVAAGLALTGGCQAVRARAESSAILDSAGTRVDATLRQVIRQVVTSPTGSLHMKVVPTSRAGSGYFSEVDIAGSPVEIKHLHVTDFELHSRNVRVDVPVLLRDHKVDTLAATTSLRAVITETDLTKMLAEGKSTADMHLKVKYVGSTLKVSGQLNWTLLSGDVSGLGKMRLAPGHKVFLDIISLKLRGVEVPQFIKDKFSEHINPVIDYNDLPFNPPFRNIKVVGSRAIITT